MSVEKMSDFFASRAEGYDEHMLQEVEGCKKGYIKMAELLPCGIKELLDLGCGTGLELEKIFERHPAVSVTGIDLSTEMIRRLKEKYAGRNLSIIHGSYLGADFGDARYDAAISFQTLHHLSHKEKTAVYTQVCKSLKPGGTYIECDYMLTDPVQEAFLFAEKDRLRKEQNIAADELVHIDTPCTIDHQINMLLQAGFASAVFVWREGNTTLILAEKSAHLVIEKGTDSDIEALSRLYNEVNDFLAGRDDGPGWRKGVYPIRENAETAITDGTLFTAKTAGQIVGSMILNHRPESAYAKARWKIEADSSEIFVVHTLLVHPSRQKEGVGRKLLDFAVQYGRNERARSIRLDVYEKNLPAIRLYEKCGFEYVDTVDLGLGKYGLNAFRLYEKVLTREDLYGRNQIGEYNSRLC